MKLLHTYTYIYICIYIYIYIALKETLQTVIQTGEFDDKTPHDKEEVEVEQKEKNWFLDGFYTLMVYTSTYTYRIHKH